MNLFADISTRNLLTRWFFMLVSVFMVPCLHAQEIEPLKSDLFNGHDLNGWQYLDDYWKVVDGTIVGSSYPNGLKFNTFLCTNREYANFDLEFNVRLTKNVNNSGVQIRSKLVDTTRFAVHGPQVDLAPGYWGSLFGEHFGPNKSHVMLKKADAEATKKFVKENDFNKIHIVCYNKQVKITINGHVTVDQSFPELPDKGIIAFQLHQGAAMEVVFKDILFKELK